MIHITVDATMSCFRCLKIHSLGYGRNALDFLLYSLKCCSRSGLHSKNRINHLYFLAIFFQVTSAYLGKQHTYTVSRTDISVEYALGSLLQNIGSTPLE